MFFKNKNKIVAVTFLAASVVALSGCGASYGGAYSPPAPSVAPQQQINPQAVENSQSPALPSTPEIQVNRANSQQLLGGSANTDSANTSDPSGLITDQKAFATLNSCIKELNSLKLLSPSDYKRLVGSFREVSEINQLYKQISSTASPDSIELLKMAIEAKTKVLCAKVRYSSVLSTESTLKKISGL